MGKLLEVNNLRVSYHTYAGEVQSVRGIDFHLDKGESLAIVGESGCGKTVTSKAIMRLIQTPPGEIKKGSQIKFNGKDILAMGKNELRQLRGGDISSSFRLWVVSEAPQGYILISCLIILFYVFKTFILSAVSVYI
jgi:oligopeptide transport system ATP-binding protein